MNEELIKQINSLNLGELNEAARIVLSNIYNRLRDEEGFGWEQHCSVVSFGSDEHDISLVVVDAERRSNGTTWDACYWI